MATAKAVREALNNRTYEEVLELCWIQVEGNGMTKDMLRIFDKAALIDCFIKRARQTGAIK